MVFATIYRQQGTQQQSDYDRGLTTAVGKTFQHYLNPLHVYCRLRDIGVPKVVAVLLCRYYERAFFNHL